MTIEAKARLYGLLPLGKVILTRFDGELTMMSLKDISLTAIRVLSDDELAVFPYIRTDEKDEFKKGEPKILVEGQIDAENLEGQILEMYPGVVYKIGWRK